MEQLYKAAVLEHSKRPRNHGPLAPCSHEARGINPLCGDRITIQLRVEDDRVRAAGFTARGCAIARASGSILTEVIAGRAVDEARQLAARLDALLRGDAPPGAGDEPLAPLLGVRAFPARLRCATLAWETLLDALASR
ncbi:MAG: SUF system NifU family Fe-S cluster assembly protein [Myxococcales bacterium]|nr:SUF system NifU family Fe-S cluster assembly protein [Myxococcales bacterium]